MAYWIVYFTFNPFEVTLPDVLRKTSYKHIEIFILCKTLAMDHYSLADASAR
jgi:hypothetical protein